MKAIIEIDEYDPSELAILFGAYTPREATEQERELEFNEKEVNGNGI